MMLHHSKAAAVVLSLVILCSLASFCQAFPRFWRDETSREEQRHIAADAAARVVSSVLKALIQKNELPEDQCSLELFDRTGPGYDKDRSTRSYIINGNDRIIEAHFNFVCRNDYRLYVHKNGDSERLIENNNITYTCQVDAGASYQPSIDVIGKPRCIPQCPELQGIANGDVDYTSRQPGGTATYSCDPGYVLHGAETRTCGEDGEWSGQEPSCKRIPQCPELQEIANGDVNYTSRQPGANATYSCNSGYVLQGAETRTCGQDRKWSGQEPKCVRLCPVLVAPLNGAVNYDNRSREPGDVATYSCRDGYQLVGPKMRICARDQDGKWSGIHPVCEMELSPPVIICSPDSLPITNGEFSPSSGLIRGTRGRLGYAVGTVVNYRCVSDRFELRGESSIICLESGEWSHPPPRCVAVRCPKLKLIANPKSVDETRRQIERDRPRNYLELLSEHFFEKNIKGNPVPYDEGSKAYLTCTHGWELMPKSPSVQTCVRDNENDDLVWTEPGTCVYSYSITKPALTGFTG